MTITASEWSAFAMPANFFLKFTPDIPGESQQEEFKGQLEVLSYSWGCTQAGGFSYGAAGGVAKSNIHDMSFSFRHCKASPKLMQYCASGKHLDKAVLTCLKAAGDKAMKFQEIEMEDIVVSSYQSGGSGDEVPIESCSVNFAKVTQKYLDQDDKGQTKLAATGVWDQRLASTKGGK